MKLAYIVNARIPTEKAHGVQIMNTCVALARAGIEVELIVPRRANPIKDDPFVFYGVERNFLISYAPAIDLMRLPILKPLSFALLTATFAVSSACMVLFSVSRKGAVIYGRDESVLSFISLFSKKVFWETHSGSFNFFARVLAKRAKGIVCISEALVRSYREKGVDGDRVCLAHDAVDVAAYDRISDSPSALRADLGLPKEPIVVTYSGSLSLYSWKGVDVLLDAVRHIERQDVVFLIVGGSAAEVSDMRARHTDPRIMFIGQVKPGRVPLYLKASDILVIPNKPGNVVSERYTSPMKLFEYMASAKTIVASDLPSLREILTDETAFFAAAGDAKSLAQAIEKAIGDSAGSSARALAAHFKASAYTWDARAAAILNFIRA